MLTRQLLLDIDMFVRVQTLQGWPIDVFPQGWLACDIPACKATFLDNLLMSILIFHRDAEVPIATDCELRSSDSLSKMIVSSCVPLCLTPETPFSARSHDFELL